MPLLALVLMLILQQVATAPPAPPVAREIARDTYLVPGAVPPERGPDGNTVLLVAPAGLIVVDTGRHPWHSDAILAFARERKLRVSTIINTHWHLDHSTGNGRIKAAHPNAKVFTTTAVNRALAPGGFLERNHAAARARPFDANLSTVRQEEAQLFLTTMETSESLRPDVSVDKSANLALAGRRLSVRVTSNAVTDADLWLYDEATRVAVLGDLVTVPAPFFETACPARWEAALDEVWATPFRLAVPGHGAPMTRIQFDTYRGAFKRFRACAGGDRPAATCATAWTNDIASLLGNDADRRLATEFATYYVGFLRKGGGASVDCQAK
jgi:glyoxylase-like metal-dependent hydrolase (beta-lactamase superfamily II)